MGLGHHTWSRNGRCAWDETIIYIVEFWHQFRHPRSSKGVMERRHFPLQACWSSWKRAFPWSPAPLLRACSSLLSTWNARIQKKEVLSLSKTQKDPTLCCRYTMDGHTRTQDPYQTESTDCRESLMLHAPLAVTGLIFLVIDRPRHRAIQGM